MSTQVLPFDIAESESPPAPEEDEWRDTRSRWKRSVIQLVATLAPVVILVIAFAIAGDRLAAAEVAGVALRDIVIAIALIVPFLSQTLAAPIYSTLNTVSYRDRDGEVLGPCGIVIPARDKGAMTDSIEKVVGDPDLYARYSSNSTTRLDRVFNIEVTLAQYHAIFEEFELVSAGVLGALLHDC